MELPGDIRLEKPMIDATLGGQVNASASEILDEVLAADFRASVVEAIGRMEDGKLSGVVETARKRTMRDKLETYRDGFQDDLNCGIDAALRLL